MFQKITIIGYLGKDPEMRYTPAGQAVTNFSVATSNKYQKGGEWVTDTVWFRVSTWGNQAEACMKYLEKGSLVLVEGRVKAHAYMKGSEPEATLEVNASTVKFLDKKGGDGAHKKEESNPYDETEGELEGFVP